MSAAIATTKTKPKGRSKPGDTSKQGEANRRNARKSTGPRTPEGKDKSRFNAVTHGLTARSELLPGEDPQELMKRRRVLLEDLQPRNELEVVQIGRIAADVWRADRAERIAEARAAFNVRHEAIEHAKREKKDALELGECLLHRPHLPLPIQTSKFGWELTTPPYAGTGAYPYRPAHTLLELEQTVAGCEWLLERWHDLEVRLSAEGEWRPSCAFKMVRLMGKLAVDMQDDFNVARALLYSLTLLRAYRTGTEDKPFDWKAELLRLLYEYKNERSSSTTDAEISRLFESFSRRLGDLPLAKIATESAGPAREWLKNLIRDEIERVGAIAAPLRAIAEADAAEAHLRLSFEEGRDGDSYRRYILSNGRLVNRTIDEFLKIRRMSEAGAFDVDSSGLNARSAVVDHDVAAIREPASSPDEEGSCAEDSFVRNEAISPCVNAPASVVNGEIGATDDVVASDEPAEVPAKTTNHGRSADSGACRTIEALTVVADEWDDEQLRAAMEIVMASE